MSPPRGFPKKKKKEVLPEFASKANQKTKRAAGRCSLLRCRLSLSHSWGATQCFLVQLPHLPHLSMCPYLPLPPSPLVTSSNTSFNRGRHRGSPLSVVAQVLHRMLSCCNNNMGRLGGRGAFEPRALSFLGQADD